MKQWISLYEPAVEQTVFNLPENPVHFVEMRLKMDWVNRGPCGLWSNSLIMLHQTVFESMFSCVVFIKISFWSSVVKTFRKKFKFPTECIHHEHNWSSNVKSKKPILPVCSILLVQMVEVVLLGSDTDLHLLFSIKSLREKIEVIISYISPLGFFTGF